MSQNPTAFRRKISYVATFAVLFAGDFLLRGSTWQGNAELHTLMETIATLLAINVGALALVRYYTQRNNTFLFIGSGFLGTGFLDGYHAVVTAPYFAALFPSAPPSLIPWSWLASRLFLSVTLCLSWIFWARERAKGPASRIDERAVYAIFSALTLACFVFFAVTPLPPGYNPNLIFPRPQEFIPAVFFGLALIGYLRKGKWRTDSFEHWLVLSLIVGFVTQATFMSLSTHLYDATFDIAHLLKQASYICVLVGLLISMYRLFWLSASEPVAVCDRATGAFVDVNQQMADLFGYTREEMLKLGAEAFSGPAAPYTQADLQRSLDQSASGARQRFERRCRAKDGHLFRAECELEPGAFGERDAVLLRVRDITERKRREAELEDSRQTLDTIINAVGARIFWKDKNLVYLGCNESFAQDAGFAHPADIIGKDDYQMPWRDQAELYQRDDRQVIEGGRSKLLIEEPQTTPEGKIITLLTNKVPLRKADGEITGVLGTYMDITERKRMELALHQRDEMMHAASAIARDLVTAASLDEAMDRALQSIGQVTSVDRIVVLESPPTEAKWILRHIWESPRITLKLDPAYIENFGAETPEIAAWNAPLKRGQIVTTAVRNATGEVKALMELFGITKTLKVPVIIDGKYWGQIGLDSCGPERIWADYEVEALETVAELLGTAIQRDRYLKKLADANHIVENTPTILYRFRGEPSLPMIYISQNVKLLGYDPAVMMASPLLYRDLIHPDDMKSVLQGMAQALAGKAGQDEFRLLTSRGQYRWFQSRYMPLLDGTGRLVEVEGLLYDITERKAAEDQVARLARTDSLTGLSNRATFIERMRQLFAAARRGAPAFSILYLDLDHFKDINDTLGHPAGDLLLATIGKRLEQSVRSGDLTARVGGDEFAVLQTDLNNTADAGSLAAKLRAAIAEPIEISGNDLHMTASIGIAIYGPDTANSDDLLAQADVALYRAKEEGRDQYRFHTAELDVRVRDQVAIAEDLRRAVERGELELYYQPQVQLSSGQIVGMEALVRWNHPKRGLLLPLSFIEIAERTGTMMTIGQWVLDTACRQMSAWRSAGIAPSTMAVNVSPVQIKTATEFVELVSTTLEKWHLAPADLELDVTESTLARLTLAHNDVLERLQRLGVKISIDDFGMKYSSLDYLRTYHVSRIKLPQPLLNSTPQDPESAAIARAIVGIARELNIEVIAEGVETEAQWSFLTAMPAVAKVQGYYYSEPVPVGEATTLLKRNLIEPASSAPKKHLVA